MFELLFEFPKNFRLIKGLCEEEKIDLNYFKDFDSVVISGMGGSGFSGDFIFDLFKDYLNKPIIVNKDYRLPKFIGENCLLFIISYSGDTEETLETFYEGEKRGAKIITITSNGKLLKLSNKKFLTFKIPEGYPPRMALPFLFYPIFFILKKFVNVDLGEDEFFNKIDSTYEEYKKENNIAKNLSEIIYDHIPIIYSSQSLYSVSLRWKQEINENSKYIAYNLTFPELNHNESVFWENNTLKDKVIFIILKDKKDSEKMKKRIEVSKELLKVRGWRFVEFESFGEKPLLNKFSLIPLGDFTSIYLAKLNKIDPYPVKIIDELKNKLKY